MAVATELLSFTTTDNETLHGLLFKPAAQPSDTALLMVHGVAMNFYLPPLATFGQALAERGHHCFVINTRAHDWINRAGDLTGFGGAAYEKFEDSELDYDGALNRLTALGYKRFILVGHSLGCIKSLMYQGTRQRQDVIGVISCSCPKQFYSARAADQQDFKEVMAQAESMIGSGRGKEFLWAKASGALALFSADTYVNKYGKHEKNDVRPHAGRLGCPHLAIAGGAEHRYFAEYAAELAQAGGASASCQMVPGSDHFYNGHESAVIEIIEEWLKQHAS